MSDRTFFMSFRKKANIISRKGRSLFLYAKEHENGGHDEQRVGRFHPDACCVPEHDGMYRMHDLRQPGGPMVHHLEADPIEDDAGQSVKDRLHDLHTEDEVGARDPGEDHQ
jgi:hypothetical protein